MQEIPTKYIESLFSIKFLQSWILLGGMPPLPDLRFDDDGKMILCFIFKISHLCNVSILISFSKGGMPPLPDLRLDDGESNF